jgi:predicted CoA-binding protein
MTLHEQIQAFLASGPFAVFGASPDPSKWGHRVFAAYLKHGYRAFPIHPTAGEVLGHTAYPDLASLPEPVGAASIITPPPVTERVVEQLIQAGVKHVWMQPGAESPAAVARAREAGLNVISGGPCLLVTLGP